MKELKHIVADMAAVFAEGSYPEDFLSVYDQMECLSRHTGRETFLVRRKSDGEFAVATCYERAAFPLQPNFELLQSLNHPGLPHCYEQYQNDRMLCVVREYIEGEPLNVYAGDRRLSLVEIVDISKQLCDILQALHTHRPPVVHRDIKPENVIIRPDGKVVLIDFEIARAVKEHAETDTVFFGTKGYAPPEQYGFGQTDGRADIYAFGVLLRWMVTDSARENANISMDAGLRHIIERCTAFSPNDRYRDAAQVRRDLERLGRYHRRAMMPRVVALTVCAVLLLMGGFAIGRYTDWLRLPERCVFQEPLIERAVRLQLGKERGTLSPEELAGVKRIYIYGTEAFADMGSFQQCSIDASTRGAIRTLNDLEMLPNLEELYIVHQSYVDVGAIAGLTNLYTVQLMHMQLPGVAAIAQIPRLKHAMLFDTGLSDVTALQNCPWLETLDIGHNDIHSTAQIGAHPNVRSLGLMWLEMDDLDDVADRMPKVQSVTLQHTTIGDPSGLLNLSRLENVYVLEEQAEVIRALFDGTGVEVHVTEN